MPDPRAILLALGVAAGVAAVTLLVFGWPWRVPHSRRNAAGAVLGVGLGLFFGCRWLGVQPHWPPREDQDRLLLVLLPTLFGTELVAIILGRRRVLAWLLRLILSLAAARVLLHGTSYLTDLAGPGSSEWTPVQAWLILGTLGLVLAGVWVALVELVREAPGRSVPLALTLACAGAAVTVMLSGYATGGQPGLALAAALAGVTAASLALADPPSAEGVVALGVVGLFALVVSGRFFGQLSTAHALLLFFSAFLGWVPELPGLRRLGPRLRGLLRVALVTGPVVVAVVLARQQFIRDAGPASPAGAEPSLEEYRDFGK